MRPFGRKSTTPASEGSSSLRGALDALAASRNTGSGARLSRHDRQRALEALAALWQLAQRSWPLVRRFIRANLTTAEFARFETLVDQLPRVSADEAGELLTLAVKGLRLDWQGSGATEQDLRRGSRRRRRR